MNHFEQLVSEWLEFNGYFVRRNIMVGKREKGGYDGELDIVGFHPETRHLVHAEPSIDTFSWERREERNRKKFGLGSKYIPELLSGVGSLGKLDQVALIFIGSKKNHQYSGGGRIMLVSELYQEIFFGLQAKKVNTNAVSQQFPLLRTIQQCMAYGSIGSTQQIMLDFEPLIKVEPD